MSIEDYEFGDMANPEVLSANQLSVVLDTEHVKWLGIFRQDVIALAKHFKLTEEDLK